MVVSRASHILDKYDELCNTIGEAAARRTVSFRGGKRHFRYKCPPGFKKISGTRTCTRVQRGELLAKSRKLKKAWRKRRGKMVRQQIKTQRTYRKMRQSGYSPSGGRRK